MVSMTAMPSLSILKLLAVFGLDLTVKLILFLCVEALGDFRVLLSG